MYGKMYGKYRVSQISDDVWRLEYEWKDKGMVNFRTIDHYDSREAAKKAKEAREG